VRSSHFQTQQTHLHKCFQGVLGHCKRECETVAKSCRDLIEDIDVDDLQVALWRDVKEGQLRNQLCTKWSSACRKSNRDAELENRKFDEDFEAKSEKDLEIEKLMESMKGMPGMEALSMFNSDDMQGSLDGAEL